MFLLIFPANMLNILQISFLGIALYTLIVGVCINWFKKYLPELIRKTFQYGKFIEEGGPKTLQVPKRWFAHFYVFASIWSSFWLVFLISTYFNFGWVRMDSLRTFLALFQTKSGTGSRDSGSYLLASSLLTFQCWKRLYETTCVSVFSPAKMDFSHYLVGFYHYFGAVLAIVSQAPRILSADGVHSPTDWRAVGLTDWLCAGVFLAASLSQLRCAQILADLRKDKRGRVVTTGYRIPEGNLFEWISAPLQLTELLMYLCLTGLLRGNSTWLAVFLWVLVNQVETALLAHWWYKKTFKNYPKERKALLPYLL